MSSDPAPHEGRAAKAMLAAKGMTQATLARALEIDKGTMSRLLNGQLRRRPDLWRQVWVTLTRDPNEAAK
jgi:plasmid maintenance system antidote protein VapI